MSPGLRLRTAAGALLLAASCTQAPPAPPAVHVAAAADLARAFPEMAEAFTRETGSAVAFTFGSSGLLARQLAEGGPWDAFASADEGFADQAVARGACDASSRARYARGRLVLWWRAGLPAPPASLADLTGPAYARIARAQPEHAPDGRAALEALRTAGVWEAIAPRVVYAENVRQALQFAESGNVDVALVARSLVEASGGRWLDVPAAMHAPLDQVIVACQRGPNPEGGAAWVRFVTSPAGRAILRRHGFDPPTD